MSKRPNGHFVSETERPDQDSNATCVVAYQGTDGAYSHSAAARHFRLRERAVAFRGYDTFDQVPEAVGAGQADFGVLPVENTTAGSINQVYDILAERQLWIVGEEIETVDHCLLVLPEVRLDQVRRVFSHPQALAQCSRFLAVLPAAAEPFTDTAMAARKVRDDGDRSQAAIASEEAGKRYGLEIINRDICNQRENYTRFFVVARAQAHLPSHVPSKTSIMFVVNHEVGALVSCLALLARHRLNLTKLESRPRPHTPWEYLFYVDFEGNVADTKVRSVLEKLGDRTLYLKIFGSYPAHEIFRSQVNRA